MRRSIIPGSRAIDVISASGGTLGEKIIREIAHPSREVSNGRIFGGWQDNVCQGTVRFTKGDVVADFPITLKIGTREGLFLQEVAGRRFSLKDTGKGSYILEVGKELPPHRVFDAANKIAGTWVIHGFNWVDRSEKICNWPYGNDPARPKEFAFKIIDGAQEKLTLAELVSRGCIRSPHVGQWSRPYALVPAMAGMKILLHEFRQQSYDVVVFRDRKISASPLEIWGGYCRWYERDLGPDVPPTLQAIANQAASPFAFHIHATKHLFPNCSLASTFIIDRLGEENLQRMLRLAMLHEPERAYRLIDEDGLTRRLKEVTKEELIYEGGRRINRWNAWENIFRTFSELKQLEEDMTFELPRSVRIVLDSHFYVVAFGLAADNGQGRTYHLSGGEMYRYLTEGDDAHAHRVRNERLFHAVKEVFGVDSFEFHVFPGVMAPNGENQYTHTAVTALA